MDFRVVYGCWYHKLWVYLFWINITICHPCWWILVLSICSMSMNTLFRPPLLQPRHRANAATDSQDHISSIENNWLPTPISVKVNLGTRPNRCCCHEPETIILLTVILWLAKVPVLYFPDQAWYWPFPCGPHPLIYHHQRDRQASRPFGLPDACFRPGRVTVDLGVAPRRASLGNRPHDSLLFLSPRPSARQDPFLTVVESQMKKTRHNFGLAAINMQNAGWGTRSRFWITCGTKNAQWANLLIARS